MKKGDEIDGTKYLDGERETKNSENTGRNKKRMRTNLSARN